MKQNAYAMALPMVILAALGSGCQSDDGTASMTPSSGRSALTVTRSDIVADESGARAMDSKLVNAWGLAFNPAGVAWVSATESGVSTVYDANGKTMLAAVTIPSTEQDEMSAPTGQVYNADESSFEGDTFVFATEGGTISGWQTTMGGQATERVDNSDRKAVYKGVTIASSRGGMRLFAADFHNARIDVFDAMYMPFDTGGFVDPDLPEGYAPFNVEQVNGDVVVTYAKQDDDKEDAVQGNGNGYVDLYNVEGTLLARLISERELDAPWGVALAPASFAAAPDRLLVGNFGDGLIHAYRFDPSSASPSATLEGALLDADGSPLAIDGLWALKFGPDAGGFKSSTLYFTAGPEDETHGTFGSIESRQTTPSSQTGNRSGSAY